MSVPKQEETKGRKAASVTTSLLRYETPFLVSFSGINFKGEHK
jgi:hypothetical protein